MTQTVATAQPIEEPAVATRTTPAVLGSYEEAIERARAIAPAFQARATQTEQLRRLPTESVRELLASGLLGLLTPRRYGGSELNLESVIDAVGEIAGACGSTGWVYMLWTAHMWLLALWPEAAQDEFWHNPNSLASSVVNTTGTPERVPGGFRWTGRGFFSSGVDHCNWLTAALNVPRDDGPPERLWMLIPRQDFTIVDDWHTVGLKGTGSKTIIVDDAFIPTYRTLRQVDSDEGTSDGARIHPNPQYGVSSSTIFGIPVAAPSIGIARTFMHAYEARLRPKLNMTDAGLAMDQGATVVRYTTALTQVDAARALLMENARRFSRTPANQVSRADRARCRRDHAFAAQSARKAVNLLWEEAGGSSLFESTDMQRLWRDANAAAAHHGLGWDWQAITWGKIALGL
ncbi:MAG: acyl-CoA dehydrogenase family protein [Chloroflexi bacterium]|nr:acyl-CoA dehydrogenase family protein [Chloroflexota bacterium]